LRCANADPLPVPDEADFVEHLGLDCIDTRLALAPAQTRQARTDDPFVNRNRSVKVDAAAPGPAPGYRSSGFNVQASGEKTGPKRHRSAAVRY
jgi:hypothetical protein